MRIVLLVILLFLLIGGCANQAPMLLLYGRAQYAYGRVEALAEVHCRAPLAPDRKEVCEEGARAQKLVREMKPIVDAELSKSSPDWNKILPYIDLILGALGKAAL